MNLHTLSLTDLKTLIEFCYQMTIDFQNNVEMRKLYSDRHAECEREFAERVEKIFEQNT